MDETPTVLRQPSVPAEPARVRDVTLYRLPTVREDRGCLVFGEAAKQVPFPVRRFFVVYQVPNEEIRGEHAHRHLEQFLVCVHGCCRVTVDDGAARQEFILDDPTLGLYVPPMIWSHQHQYSDGGVLLVLASDAYDETDYIRSYPEFLRLLAEGGRA